MSEKLTLFRLLLVEDNAHDRQAFRRAFRKAEIKAEITECVRAEEALSRIQEHPDGFDVIVSDHNLPGMSGLEFCRELIRQGIQVPLVILTGGGSEYLAIEALKAGVDDYLIKDPDGGFLDLLPVVLPEVWRKYQDRLARKRAEEQLRKLSMAVEQSPVITVIADTNGNIEYVNPRFTRITGYAFEEVVGRNPKILKSGEHPEAFYRELWKTIMAGVEWWGEFYNKKKDGSYYWELASIMPIKDDNGMITHFLKVSEDITPRKRMEEAMAKDRSSLADRVLKQADELSRANAELTRSVRLKDEFLAIMSHELRTPLNVILGMTEALLDEVYGSMNERQLGALRRVDENGRHLLALILDILDLSEIGAGKMDLEPAIVPVEPVCQASLRFLHQAARKKQLKISTVFDSAVTTMYADERRVKQALVHLLSNAIKFTPEGGRIGLDVGQDPVKQVICFTIWDTGIGIAREDLERLFLPFTQLDSTLTRRYEGMGVGLSLVYHIVAMHGGSVKVESNVNSGSRFTISFPALPEKEPKEAAPPSQIVHPPDVNSLPPLILFGEDHEETLARLSEYFITNGYRVMAARNGNEVLNSLTEAQLEFLLLNMQLPEKGGLEIIRSVRARAKGKLLPIVAVSALILPGDRERCLAAGANEYFEKPLSPGDLSEIQQKFLKR